MKLEATLSLDQAAARRWDVAIVGSGPAGAFAARELARGGAAVLLIDKASFPRSKVCGACINGRAMSILRRSGLDAFVMCRGAVPLRRFRVYAGRRNADVPLAAGVAISRDLFDTALVESAIDAGAAFLPRRKQPWVAKTARSAHGGLANRLFEPRHHGFGGSRGGWLGWEPCRPAARLQATRSGALVDWSGDRARRPSVLLPGTIFMGCGRRGYVGLVRVEGGRLNIAAAIDPVGCSPSRRFGTSGVGNPEGSGPAGLSRVGRARLARDPGSHPRGFASRLSSSLCPWRCSRVRGAFHGRGDRVRPGRRSSRARPGDARYRGLAPEPRNGMVRNL